MEGEEIQPGSPQASLPRRRPVQPPTPEVAAGRWWSALPTGRFMRVPAPVTAPVPAPPAPAAVPAPPVAAARGGRTTAGGGQRPIMRRTLAAALLAVLLLGILVGRLSTHTQVRTCASPMSLTGEPGLASEPGGRRAPRLLSHCASSACHGLDMCALLSSSQLYLISLSPAPQPQMPALPLQAPAATTQAPTPAKTPAPARTSGTIAQQASLPL